jgi:hypothetical protein
MASEISQDEQWGSVRGKLNALWTAAPSVASIATQPLSESGFAVTIGGASSNVGSKAATTLELSSLNPASDMPTSGYRNLIDHTRHYDWVESKIGHNESLVTNDGRTQDSVYRVRLIKSGQGDGAAYNFSVFVTAPQRPGVTHWLANAAGIGINGTVVIAADGAYANARETVISDKPSATAFFGTGFGDVVRLNRNAGNRPIASGGIGEIWGAYRANSEGPEPVDNMISGTGKFHTGIDLSMASLAFTGGNAIALKIEDGIAFDGTDAELNDATHFYRVGGRMTSGGRYKIRLTADGGTTRLQFLADNLQAFSIRRDATLGALASVETLNINQDVFQAAGKTYRIGGSQVLAGRKTGWSLATGSATRTTFDTASVTLPQLAERVKALLDDLFYATGVHTAGHGLIGS